MTLMLMNIGFGGGGFLLIRSGPGEVYATNYMEREKVYNSDDTERCAVCNQSMNALDIDAHCPTGFCLPMYEGEINWSSDFYAFVCRKCHDQACAAYEAALKEVEDPNTRPFEGRV